MRHLSVVGESPRPASQPPVTSCPEQLAFFGDPVPFSDLPSIHDTVANETRQHVLHSDRAASDSGASAALIAFDDMQDQLDLLLDGIPAAEQARAAQHVYVTSDGVVRTRYRQLTSV